MRESHAYAYTAMISISLFLRQQPFFCSAVLAEGLARGVVRDRTLQNGQAISVMQVEVTKDLQLARVFWEPMDFAATAADTARLQRALHRRRGVLVNHVNAYLRQRVAPKARAGNQTQHVPNATVHHPRTPRSYLRSSSSNWRSKPNRTNAWRRASPPFSGRRNPRRDRRAATRPDQTE